MNKIRIDYTNALGESVGRKNGISSKDLVALSERAQAIHADMTARARPDCCPFSTCPTRTSPALCSWRQVQLLGQRGGPGHRRLRAGPARAGQGPAPALSRDHGPRRPSGLSRLFEADNIDPDYFLGLLEALNLTNTVFIVISKSARPRRP